MKKFFFITTISVLTILFFSFWTIVSDGYDRQNKLILSIKKIIHPHFARKIRDTIFAFPNLKKQNRTLELQVKKYEQGYNGTLFNEQNNKSIDEKYSYNLKFFFLPFKRLDTNLGWQANASLKRAHYLEIIEDKILVISGEGESLIFDKQNITKDRLDQKPVKNNIDLILKEKNSELFAIRDLYYEDNFVYVSIVEKNNEQFTINIYRAAKNFTKLNFDIFFESQEYSPKYTLQTGGRIEKFKDNKILFAIGFFGKHNFAQDKKSLSGKIISIDKKNRDYEILSVGHRNPQGLYYSKKNNIIMNTEHGPKGGDEVNFNFLNNDKMKNFGWPISSYGKPYPGTENIFEKEGWLKKSHSENNFNEPIKYFVPSIGISELIYVDDYKDLSGSIFASSLRAGSIYILNIDKNMKKILDTDRIFFKNKRIRDLKYDKKSKLFFILFENTPSVGVLKVN